MKLKERLKRKYYILITFLISLFLFIIIFSLYSKKLNPKLNDYIDFLVKDEIYQKVIKSNNFITNEEVNDILYIDKNKSLIGEIIGDKKIYSPDILINKKNVCVLICSAQEHVVRDIMHQLNEWNIEGYLLDEIILKQHSKEVLQCYDMLEDQISKQVYEGIIRWRILGKAVEIPKSLDDTYFALDAFNKLDDREIFVDCGAYIGDTFIEEKEHLKR